MAANARGLLDDAELLLDAGRWPRAHALAMLAAEEWAKAYSVLTLSFMPPEMRAKIPLRGFLEGHIVKTMNAEVLRDLDGARPGVAGRVAAMPLAEMLRTAVSQATTANTEKMRGLYADLMADGTLSLPSDVTQSDASDAVARARQVGLSAALLHDQEALAAFSDPPAGFLTGAETLFGRLPAVGDIVDPDTAAALLTELAAGLAAEEPPSAG